MVHRSPACKFADDPEGVGHRHKLTKLVEESNNLISLSIPIEGHGQARRMLVTRNATSVLEFPAIWKESYQYVFRGKILIKADTINEAIEILPLGLKEKNFKVLFIERVCNLQPMVENEEIDDDEIVEIDWLLSSNYKFKILDRIYPYVTDEED